MAIKTVQAVLNGQTYTLNYDASSGTYQATITAPGQTSYNQPGGYYSIAVSATNEAGTTGSADGAALEGLRLVVRETLAPVIAFANPTAGAYLSNNLQPVTFTLTDETGGSGVDIDTLSVTLDGVTQAEGTLEKVITATGYTVTFTPPAAYADGTHTIAVSVSDHDGNAAEAKSLTFVVDTVPPVLNLSAPTQNLITAKAALTVEGTTNDATSSPVTVTVTLNGADQGTVTVSADGSFSKALTLAEGSNAIVVKATDKAGQETSVSRSVTLDTSVPKIVAAEVTPSVADTGATVTISVTIA